MVESQTISEQLSNFIVKVGYKDIPKPIVEKSKMVILDTLGCMLAGAATQKGKAIAKYFASISADGKATLFGGSKRCSPEMASFANGTFAHMLEYDDGHRPSDNHNACVTVPAAFSVCESEQKSGADFITAFTIGYEIMGRVGRAVLLPRTGQHFHGTGTCGTFGGAAAAGKVLGLNSSQMANALGIAGTASAGLKEVMMSGFDSKPLHAGRGAFNGIVAACLAREGIEGPITVLEGENGFCRAVTPGYTFEPLLPGLFSTWEVTYSGFKVRSTCGITFTAVDCMLDIMKENNLKSEQTASIRIGVPTRTLSNPVYTKRFPRSAGEARFSVIYAVAVAALNGQVSLNEISERQVKSPDSRRMIELTELVLDKEAEEVDIRDRDKPMFFPPASIDVITKDGQHFRRFRAAPVGYDPIGSPLTSDEVAAKFENLASQLLKAKQVQSVIDIVSRLEEQKDLSQLSASLAV